MEITPFKPENLQIWKQINIQGVSEDERQRTRDALLQLFV